MKRLALFLIIVSAFFSFKAQEEFSFEMYFEDAMGNRDTIVLGYDSTGTDTIDVTLNELNIASIPLDSTFDVRITNGWSNNQYNSGSVFHTKKQIVKNNCGSWFDIISIDVKCSNWPVTASWDNNVFNDSCNVGSLLTSITPGGWFDVGSPSNLGRVYLMTTNQVVFYSNNASNPFYTVNGYINNANDTISTYWTTFGDSSLLTLSINEKGNPNNIKIYPNPAKNEITIQLDSEEGFDYTVINISGQIISSGTSINRKVEVGNFPQGYYIIQIRQGEKHFSAPLVISR